MDKKICNRCKVEKNLEDFHVDKSRADGRKYICKACVNTGKGVNKHKDFDRSLSTSIYQAMLKNKSGFVWERIVGFTLSDLKQRLEETFVDGMTWENYTVDWVIEKIIPPSYFKYSNFSGNEFKKCWNIKNFRAVSKKEHRKKSKKELSILIEKYDLYDIVPIGLNDIKLIRD